MIKIKLADGIIESHLVDSKGNLYCSIPISVDKKLKVEGLFDKLAAIGNYSGTRLMFFMFVFLACSAICIFTSFPLCN